MPSLENAIKTLEAIGQLDVKNSSDAERGKAARLFGRGLGLIRETFEDITDFRQFLSVQNTATIRNWAVQENAPAEIFIRRDGLSILIGKSADTAQEIRLKPVIDLPLPALPTIAMTA